MSWKGNNIGRRGAFFLLEEIIFQVYGKDSLVWWHYYCGTQAGGHTRLVFLHRILTQLSSTLQVGRGQDILKLQRKGGEILLQLPALPLGKALFIIS